MKSKKMDNKKRDYKFIFGVIFAIILIIFIVFITLFKIFSLDNKDSDKSDDNSVNSSFIEDKDVNGILFTNIKCSYDGKNSLITYTIVNHTKEAVNLLDYEVMIRDKDGIILAVISPNLDYEIKPDESYDTGNAIDIDVSNAYSMELVLDEEE